MSKGLGHIERAIGDFFSLPHWPVGGPLWANVETVALYAYATDVPTAAQRVAIRRAMHSFARKHHKFYLDGGWDCTPLYVVGPAGCKPELRKRPVAVAERSFSPVPKWRRASR